MDLTHSLDRTTAITAEGSGSFAWRAEAAGRGVELPNPRGALAVPLLMALAVVVGIGLVTVFTPIAGRGDYGQWLMSSRYYLGEAVPEYRSISALPPLVPLLLAGIRVLVPDPVIALQIVSIVMLAGLATSFYLAGSVLSRSSIGGVVSVAVALLVTDRFLELAAFGGLFQLAAIIFLNVAIAAFVRAGDGLAHARRWFTIGAASLALLAVSHVGTATVGLPIGVTIACLSAIRLRHSGWRRVLWAATPLILIAAAIGAYALVALVPASRDYVSNPASLAYRGPGRLIASLFAYWSTGAVVIVGAATVVLGATAEVARRTWDRWGALFVWSLLAWGSVAYTAASGTSTDYPRFSTVVLAPLVIGASMTLVWLARTAAGYMPTVRSAWSVQIAAALLMLVAGPFAVTRYQSQITTFQPRDADGLTAAIQAVDEHLGHSPGVVLTAVRDGKWLEGVTGREALFSLPVRYAFRPDEWQRSVDADALLRSTAALTNQFFFVKFTDRATSGAVSVPTNPIVAINHGGEYVDVLQLQPSETRLIGRQAASWQAASGPHAVVSSLTAQGASIRTEWRQRRGRSSVAFNQTISLLQNGSTLTLSAESPGNRIKTELRPPPGIAFTSVRVAGQEAQICLTTIGQREPCLRIWAGERDAVLTATNQGLGIATSTSTRLQLYVTDLTPGGASVGLGLIDPQKVVAQHDVRAAILIQTDPAFAERRERIEALGFRLFRTAGLYAVFFRDGPALP